MKLVTYSLLALLFAALLGSAGCSRGGNEGARSAPEGATLPSRLVLTEAPPGAQPLVKAKASAKAGDSITFVARIGGRKEPFVSERAVFVVIDSAIPSCAEMAEDACPTPWDYCCETPEDILANSATVQLVDERGQPYKISLGERPRWKPLATITVVGRVMEKSDDGRLVVNAEGVYFHAS